MVLGLSRLGLPGRAAFPDGGHVERAQASRADLEAEYEAAVSGADRARQRRDRPQEAEFEASAGYFARSLGRFCQAAEHFRYAAETTPSTSDYTTFKDEEARTLELAARARLACP
jgi:hypothetical protein